jgi:drug/metabolite transporter (DMT)-like permease
MLCPRVMLQLAPLSKPRAYALLHATIFVWGFTAILGKLITVSAWAIVWYRQWIAALVLLLALVRTPRLLRISVRDVLILAGVAAIVSVHWVCFYASIKVSGVAVAVVCLASTSFFVSFIEPVVFGRPVRFGESALGLAVLLGVVLLVRGEAKASVLGIVLGVVSALAASIFGTLNGSLVRRMPAAVMSFYELAFGALWLSGAFFFVPDAFAAPATLSMADAFWIVVLGVFCTAIPWLTSLRAMHTLSPFTVALSLNLEPVYSLMIAWFVFPSSERFAASFYLGTAVLIVAVLANARLKTADRALA